MHRKKQLILLLVVVAVALFFIKKTPTSGRPEGQLWFYNEVTGQLFSASDLSIPPVETVSGPGTGVRAWVFSCGDCSNPDDRFIGYLEKMHPDTKRLMDEEIAKTGASTGVGKLLDKYAAGILVRSPGGSNWVSRMSSAGQAIISNSLTSGNCSNPKPCLP